MLTNRQIALRDGLTQYQSTNECIRGHLGMRYTPSKACVECRKEKWSSGEWRQSPEQTKARRARRKGELRAMLELNQGVTTLQVKLLGISQGWKCAYCGASDGLRTLHLDHKRTLRIGGTHTIDNLQFLCEFHNVDKGVTPDDEYRTLNGIPAVTKWDSF